MNTALDSLCVNQKEARAYLEDSLDKVQNSIDYIDKHLADTYDELALFVSHVDT